MRTVFVFIGVLAMVLAAGCALGQSTAWELKYLGNMPPDSFGSCGVWNGRSFRWQVVSGNPALGAVVDDPEAIDGKAYRINDNSNTDSLLWRTGSENIGSATGATVVARVKTVSETNGSGNIGIQGSGLTTAYHWGGPSGHVWEPMRNRESWVVGDNKYHILRLTAAGNQDFVSVPYLETFTAADGVLNGRLGFSGTAGAEISIVNDAVQVTGGSGETTAGVRVAADPDSQNKIRITCTIKQGIAGTDGWVSSLKVYDVAGNWIAGWQAASYGMIRGRAMNTAYTSVVPYNTAGSVLEMIIDTVADTVDYRVDNVSIGVCACPPSDGPAGSNNVGRLQFTRFNDGRAAGATVLWDDLAMNGTPLSGRTIRLYLDENPTPVVEILNATQGSNDPDSFLMGAMDAAGVQDVYFDWIVGSAAGAFAPGEEVGVIGHSLLIDPTVVTTIAAAKQAPEHAQVELAEVSITSLIKAYDEYYNIVPIALTVADYQDVNPGDPLNPVHKPAQGIRVVYNPEFGFGFYQGEHVKISGTCETIDGERVIVANSVEEVLTMAPTLGPQAVSNKMSGGGPFGMQAALVGDFSKLTGLPAYGEPFDYPDGRLVGKGFWTGTAASEIGVSGGALVITSDGPLTTASQARVFGDCGTGEISVKFKAKAGFGASNFWTLTVFDEAGKTFGYWMGKGNGVRGRMADGSYTPEQSLDANWKTLEIKIHTSMDATEFLVDGVRLGTTVFDHSKIGCGDTIGKISLDRLATDADGRVMLDDLQVSPGSANDIGLNNVGMYTTIFGRVTEVVNDSLDPWLNYFYLDDGSGLRDGTVNIEGNLNVGIRCRPCSADFYETSLPIKGDYVSATGVMGVAKVAGNNVRFFYTWSIKSY